jgi:hypothetical protein
MSLVPVATGLGWRMMMTEHWSPAAVAMDLKRFLSGPIAANAVGVGSIRLLVISVVGLESCRKA